ncbi:MAG TPA: Spo0E family sporulation regulatory protein-aspartic acid phosphatase [Syntrophomonas sp.]|jgi:hypothetical protein|nr:Spo0E family sporulation regulatory protein-aspartic acid phosphatase [Syntrophomonas sp.]
MDIITKIEDLRLKLTKLGEEKGLKHPDVIRLSKQLDDLIIQYYRVHPEERKE